MHILLALKQNDRTLLRAVSGGNWKEMGIFKEPKTREESELFKTLLWDRLWDPISQARPDLYITEATPIWELQILALETPSETNLVPAE